MGQQNGLHDLHGRRWHHAGDPWIFSNQIDQIDPTNHRDQTDQIDSIDQKRREAYLVKCERELRMENG